MLPGLFLGVDARNFFNPANPPISVLFDNRCVGTHRGGILYGDSPRLNGLRGGWLNELICTAALAPMAPVGQVLWPRLWFAEPALETGLPAKPLRSQSVAQRANPKTRPTTSSWPRSSATSSRDLAHRYYSDRVTMIFTLKLEPLGCLERCR